MSQVGVLESMKEVAVDSAKPANLKSDNNGKACPMSIHTRMRLLAYGTPHRTDAHEEDPPIHHAVPPIFLISAIGILLLTPLVQSRLRVSMAAEYSTQSGTPDSGSSGSVAMFDWNSHGTDHR